MNLILEIVDGGASQAGSGTRKVFGLDGGRIGRAPDCDWVLQSPYISRHHATIVCSDGVFYIESAGDNGVAVNDENALLDRQERRALRHGDMLFIDDIRIRVVVSAAAAAPAPGPIARDPTLPPGPLGPASQDLDPLSKLGRLPTTSTTSPPVAPAWTHSPSVSDHFRPPPPVISGPAPVDEDWNQTVYDREQLRPEPPPLPVVEPPPVQPQRTALPVPPQRTAPPVPPQRTAPPPVPPPAPPVAPQRAVRPALNLEAAQHPPRAGLDLEAALRQLGIEPSDIAPEIAEELATVVQSVLQGLIDVLRARAQFRNQLRLPAVRVKSTRNNPFDFAINAQDALGSLVDRSNPGYMPAAEAFADSFGDMRRHELATLAGIRAGFQSMLRLFEPQALQDRFDRQLRHAGFLQLGAKLRYWELYSDLFEQLQADPDGTFQRMFGQAFADAYARQQDALRSVPEPGPRSG